MLSRKRTSEVRALARMHFPTDMDQQSLSCPPLLACLPPALPLLPPRLAGRWIPLANELPRSAPWLPSHSSIVQPALSRSLYEARPPLSVRAD